MSTFPATLVLTRLKVPPNMLPAGPASWLLGSIPYHTIQSRPILSRSHMDETSVSKVFSCVYYLNTMTCHDHRQLICRGASLGMYAASPSPSEPKELPERPDRPEIGRTPQQPVRCRWMAGLGLPSCQGLEDSKIDFGRNGSEIHWFVKGIAMVLLLRRVQGSYSLRLPWIVKPSESLNLFPGWSWMRLAATPIFNMF